MHSTTHIQKKNHQYSTPYIHNPTSRVYPFTCYLHRNISPAIQGQSTIIEINSQSRSFFGTILLTHNIYDTSVRTTLQTVFNHCT